MLNSYSLTNAQSRETVEENFDGDGYGHGMELRQRIFKARSDKKMTQEELAKAVGKSRSAVAQWESGDVIPRRTTLEAIAKATGCEISWLERGVDTFLPPTEMRIGLEVVGEVSAGVWKEAEVLVERQAQPVATHPEYPAYAQRLYKVVGDSINQVANNGDFLHTVSVKSGGVEPEDGDLVIVRRSRHGLAEYTAKQMIYTDGRWVLRPLSDHPAWQKDIELEGDDDTEIEVMDVVIAKWSPIYRRGKLTKNSDPFRT